MKFSSSAKALERMATRLKKTSRYTEAPDCLRIAGRRVVVDYVNPPVPILGFDFCAVFEGHDIGDPQGYGNTAAEAIEDLHEKATGEQA